MPIYEYRCEKGHTLEVLQRMGDDPLPSCTTCGAPVQRVFHPVAVHFKGSGFYSTDYGRNNNGGKGSDEGKAKEDADSSAKGSSDGSKDSSKSEGSDSKPKAGSSGSKPSKD